MPIKFNIEKRENKKAYGKISWPEKNLSSVAISGPYGRSELPDGLYHARRVNLLDKPNQSPYCDSLQNCWFQFIEPQFSTNRDNLGIHPDGNSIGTLGCIGLLDSNTKLWYEAFKSIPNNELTIVEVIDNTVS
jgi:hypothetical protein